MAKAVFLLISTLLIAAHALQNDASAIERTPSGRPVIHWVASDFPPFLVLPDDSSMNIDINKARGPFAAIYRELVQALPHYEHRFVRVTFRRAEIFFAARKGYCTIQLQKSAERKRFLSFGEELARSFPVGLVIHARGTPGVQAGKKDIELAGLLRRPLFRLGVMEGRSYSQKIDDILSQSRRTARIVGDGAMGNLFLLLEKKRLDGILAYYLEMTDYQKNNEGVPPLRFLKLKEAPDHISVWASCEKTPWGDAVLKEVNQAIRYKNLRKRIQEFILNELPGAMKKDFQRLYEAPF